MQSHEDITVTGFDVVSEENTIVFPFGLQVNLILSHTQTFIGVFYLMFGTKCEIEIRVNL